MMPITLLTLPVGGSTVAGPSSRPSNREGREGGAHGGCLFRGAGESATDRPSE